MNLPQHSQTSSLSSSPVARRKEEEEQKQMRLFLLLLPLASATFRDQSAGAKGYVSCRGVRQPGVFVQLYDEDSIFPFDSDDLMGSTTADGLGHFCVKGSTSEVTDIEPYILIEHNCGYEGLDQKTEFFYYLDKEFITEGNVTRTVQNLGEIELLTVEAPIQDFKKKYYHHKHLAHSQRERIDQCIPLYVTYKDFFEKEVFGTGSESVKVLETDDDGFQQPAPPPPDETIRTELEEVVKIHEEIKDIEKIEQENLRKLEEETRRLEEERIRLEEERKHEEELRKLEEEKQRLQEEENHRREEEERRKEDERRREEERQKAEEDRLREEERRKQEYEKAMEEYRRREEERRLEILRREEESRRETKVTSVSFADDGKDDPCYRRIKRGAKLDPSDPCYRRLKG